jgi:heavy metal efflux system protein
MLESIISFSLKNKLTIGLLMLALVAWGTYSYTQLPIDAVPDITNNQVQVISTAPDLATEEVERLITFPIEQALANIPGKIELRSFSRFGLSLVTIVFDDKTDVYWARQQVAERLNQAMGQIPPGLTKPELAPVTTGLGEIYQYTLKVHKGYENRYSLTDLRTIQDWIIRRQLLGTPGVADVSSFGGYLKQYEVSVKPEDLSSMNLSFQEIFDALQNNNQNTGGSYIERGPKAWLIRTEGFLQNSDEIEQVVIKRTSSGIPILIKDVADVTEGHAIRYGAMTSDTTGETVGAIVLMLKGANSSAVIGEVKTRIESIRKSLPEGISIEPYLDRTKLVDKAIGTVSKNLTEGALIVIFVLVMLLGNLRAGLIVASVIPLAMLFALGMMRLTGVSGNLMSLGAIDFGLIVDGAVIIVEAVIHLLYLKYRNDQTNSIRISGADLDKAVQSSASKMIRFAAFGQLIILIVYVPILSLVGVEGKMFRPMAETVAFAIIGALILSLTWVPVASSLFLSKTISFKPTFSDRFIHAIQKRYQPFLERTLRHPKILVSIAIGALVATGLLFTQLGGEFIPTLDEGDFAVETRVLTGSSLTETVDAAVESARILLRQFPEVEKVTGKIGSSEIPVDPMPIEACDLIITLKDRSEWTSASSRDELAEKMTEALSAMPGVTFGFQQPIQMRFNELMTGARQDVVVKVYGEDLDQLSTLAGKISKIAAKVDGATDLYVEQITGLPQIIVRIKRDALARYGISVNEVNSVVNTAFAGKEAGLVFEGERRFSLMLRLDPESRNSEASLDKLYVPDMHGTLIPLRELADIVTENGPVQIQREDARRRVIVGFNVRNRDVESVVNELQQKVQDKVKLPAGYSVTYGGQFQNLVEARTRLAIAVPISLLLIFILLYFAFGSGKYAALIFTAVPFSAIGGVLALWIRDLPFSISAGVGFIALFGVAVLNGIVLIGAFNELKKSGVTDIRERIHTGTSERLRPILMTALVASLGFLPMAISQSAGAEVQRPLATVVIGGLITATLLTLILLPVFYLIMENGFRFKVSKMNMLIGAILLASSTQVEAQENISLDSALNMSLRNHPSIKASTKEYEASRALKGSAYDMGNFSVDMMGGQYNSVYTDGQFSLKQSIPFPTSMVRKSQVLNETTLLKNYELIVNKLNLWQNVAFTWHTIRVVKARIDMLDSLNVLMDELVKASALRVKTGAAIPLEELNMQQKASQLKVEQSKTIAELSLLEWNLQKLTGSKSEVSAPKLDGKERPVLPTADINLNLQNHPFQHLKTQQTSIAKSNAKLERSKLLPEIQLGYFNQSLTGFQSVNGVETYFSRSDRFTGYSAGLAFPLWFKPQASRIKHANLMAQAAASREENNLLELELHYKRAMIRLTQANNQLDYMESAALPASQKALENARKSWKEGEISYLELIHTIEQRHRTSGDWLDARAEYVAAFVHVLFYQNASK